MADDIDDLLDEVESKFVISQPSKKRSGSKVDYSTTTTKNCVYNDSVPPQNTNPKHRSKKVSDHELDAMIDDIMGEPDSPNEDSRMKPNNIKISHNRIVTSAQRKCFPIYLGGTDCELGIASSMNSLCCDKLRCTACDFKIVQFDDRKWHSTTDYLFLRNNVPDAEKLSMKLIKDIGTRAYACQCKWINVSVLTDLRTCKDYKWVCGKH